MTTDAPTVKRKSIGLPQLEFAGTSTALATLVGFFTGLNLNRDNLIGAEFGLLSTALWMVLAIHFYRRYRLRKEQSLGMLAPCLGLAASVTALVALISSTVCG